MNEHSMINKKAWEYRTYEAWTQRDGYPFRKILASNPSKEVLGDYFDTGIHEADIAYKDYLNISNHESVPSCSIRIYNLSEIINSVIKQGFIIKEFNEQPSYYNKKLPGEFTVYAYK